MSKAVTEVANIIWEESKRRKGKEKTRTFFEARPITPNRSMNVLLPLNLDHVRGHPLVGRTLKNLFTTIIDVDTKYSNNSPHKYTRRSSCPSLFSAAADRLVDLIDCLGPTMRADSEPSHSQLYEKMFSGTESGSPSLQKSPRMSFFSKDLRWRQGWVETTSNNCKAQQRCCLDAHPYA